MVTSVASPGPAEPPASAGAARAAVPAEMVAGSPAPPAKVVRRRRKAAAPDLPLGSLSQPQGAVVGPLACTDCASVSLTRLVVANPVGVPAVFVSCHDCERSGWYAVDGGHEVTREAVVTAAAAETGAAAGDAASDDVAHEPVVRPAT